MPGLRSRTRGTAAQVALTAGKVNATMLAIQF
jgi:hypothetical protein